jgi:tRNA pseudouridine38-40 synthase
MLRHDSALGRRYFHIVRHRIDAEAMHAAAASLVGEHDFTAFAASDSAGETRLCTVLHAGLESEGGLVTFEITANRFLHNMVRRLAGALVEIGRGRLRPEQLLEIVRAQDSSRGGPCLPPCGLYLVEVRYPAELEAAATDVVDAAAPDP